MCKIIRCTRYCGRTLASADDPGLGNIGSEVATSKATKSGLHTLFWHTSWQLVAHVLAASTEHQGAGSDRAVSMVHSQGAYAGEGTKPVPGPLLSEKHQAVYWKGEKKKHFLDSLPHELEGRAISGATPIFNIGGRADRFRGHCS